MADIKVGIIMGSQSDWPTMKEAADVLDELGVAYETKIVSAHRTPDRLWDYGKTAVDRGLQVIIAGAGGAAHLPGMMASKIACRLSAFRCRPKRCPAWIASIPSCKCRAAFPLPLWPSVQPGQRTAV